MDKTLLDEFAMAAMQGDLETGYDWKAIANRCDAYYRIANAMMKAREVWNPRMRPAYYVKHPDGSYSIADPQP